MSDNGDSVPEGDLYGSDVMAEVIEAFDFPYLTLNPGASFRGLHDSVVNHTHRGDDLIQCTHEKIAVGIAHGYAKATGVPMCVLVHDTVGLLQATMGIYCAFMDRVPMLILGGTGPMALEKRRPHIDWIHTSNVQGNVVRDYTKWDDQPASVAAVPETLARGYRIAAATPQGPVYIGLDAGLQEERVDRRPPYPDFTRLGVPTPPNASEEDLRRLAKVLLAAERPVLVPGFAGRDPASFDTLVQLAELLDAGVLDTNVRLNFPTRHPLNATATDAIDEADVVFFIDVKDMAKVTSHVDGLRREVTSRIPPGATVVDLGFNDLGLSAWSHDFSGLVETDLQITADSSAALPRLLEICAEMLAAGAGADRASWRDRVRQLHDEAHERWRRIAEERHDQVPVSTARLAAEVWEAIREHDWVLTAGTASDWALRLWDFDKPYRHAGATLGTATQIAISIGVALGHRGTGRLVVDLQPDGDLLYDAAALWTVAHHEIPMLVVMFNNNAYYNDWEHQARVAELRGRPVENAHLGMDLSGPSTDFAMLARSFGWHAAGPITDPNDIAAALREAIHVVLDEGRPALVDVVCQPQ